MKTLAFGLVLKMYFVVFASNSCSYWPNWGVIFCLAGWLIFFEARQRLRLTHLWLSKFSVSQKRLQMRKFAAEATMINQSGNSSLVHCYWIPMKRSLSLSWFKFCTFHGEHASWDWSVSSAWRRKRVRSLSCACSDCSFQVATDCSIGLCCDDCEWPLLWDF